MKLLDNILDKIGTDKALHFLVAGFLTALLSPLGWIAIGITSVVVMIAELLKERFFDDSMELDDVYYTLSGCLTVVIFNILF